MDYLLEVLKGVILLSIQSVICDALRDFMQSVQFKKREKFPWRSVTFSKVGC